MNELIERLAREAGITDRAAERFAALVAEECAKTALSTRPPQVDVTDNPAMACHNKLTIYRSEVVARIRAAFPMPKP